MSVTEETVHTRETILVAIQEILSDMLSNVVAEKITPETDLLGAAPLHLDSIDQLEFLMSLEIEFDMDISEEESQQFSTVQHVVEFVAKRLGL